MLNYVDAKLREKIDLFPAKEILNSERIEQLKTEKSFMQEYGDYIRLLMRHTYGKEYGQKHKLTDKEPTKGNVIIKTFFQVRKLISF